jgi:hypothetical protein
MSWTIICSVSGPRSMLGALVKFSWIYWKVPAALQTNYNTYINYEKNRVKNDWNIKEKEVP